MRLESRDGSYGVVFVPSLFSVETLWTWLATKEDRSDARLVGMCMEMAYFLRAFLFQEEVPAPRRGLDLAHEVLLEMSHPTYPERTSIPVLEYTVAVCARSPSTKFVWLGREAYLRDSAGGWQFVHPARPLESERLAHLDRTLRDEALEVLGRRGISG